MPFSSDRRQTYYFGSFRLDARRRLLYNGSEPKPLSEKLFMILLLLVQANGGVVSKEEFLSRIWSEEDATDGNLAQHMYMLRKVLGERARENSYVVTVGGVGYRFAMPVTALPDREDLAAIDPFQRYCLGNYYLEKRTATAMLCAGDLFAEAVRQEPSDVPAMLGQARAEALLAEYLHVAPKPAFERARGLVERALQLEPTSSMALAIASELELWSRWDVAAAERTLDAALALNSQLPLVHSNATWLHLCKRDYQMAHAAVRAALTLDPASLPLLLLQNRIHLYSGNYRQAITGMTDLLQTDPGFHLARRYRAQAYIFDHQPMATISDLLAVPDEPMENAAFRLPLLARAHGDCGHRGDAEKIYVRLQGMREGHYVAHWNLAQAAAAAGLEDQALAHLSRAWDEREPALLLLQSLPWFRSLENRPEFRRVTGEIERTLQGSKPQTGDTRFLAARRRVASYQRDTTKVRSLPQNISRLG